MTVLVVAEKNSAARNMAAALGGMVGTYGGVDYEIVALRGHLYEYAEPHEQVTADLVDRYKKWDLSALPWQPDHFAWKRKPQQGVSDILKTLKSKAATATEIVCATDVDPSGEGGLLFAEPIIELGITPRRLTRMYFTDEAPASIQQAFVKRKDIVGGIQGFDEFRKAEARAKFDWLSQQFTRVASLSAGQRAVLRQGRLKSAMVLLVGDQFKAWSEYVKTPFFENRFRDEHGVIYADPDEPRFPDAASVPQKYGPSAVVLDSKANKSVTPPKLLDLAALSARLSKKGVKADVVLATYQKMYEDLVVSYPRTEDKTITAEQFDQLVPLAEKIAAVVGVDPAVLTHRTARRTHVKDTGAHGANRPGPKVPDSLQTVERTYGPVGKLIYEELARSFLAILAEDYIYEAQVGHLQTYPTFKGTASVPRSWGWKQVFQIEVDPDEESDENLKGLGTQAEPFVYEGANKRPEHPTMSWLMKQLEKRDVGTGATRTSTYAEVTKPESAKNKYPLLHDTRGKITMTEYGEMSYRLLPGTRIGDLGLTEYVFTQMRAIATGSTTAQPLLDGVGQWVLDDIAQMKQNATTMRKELGMSEQATTTKEKFEGPWAARGGQVIRFSRTWSGVRFTDEQCEALLAGQVIEFEAISQRTKKPFEARGSLAEQEFESGGKKVKYVGFKADFSAKTDSAGNQQPPAAWCGHVFTDAEKKTLVDGGKVFADDFKSQKSKRDFACTVRFAEEDGKPGKRIIPEFG